MRAIVSVLCLVVLVLLGRGDTPRLAPLRPRYAVDLAAVAALNRLLWDLVSNRPVYVGKYLSHGLAVAFDSTLGFPGEGPRTCVCTSWHLAVSSTSLQEGRRPRKCSWFWCVIIIHC